LYNQDLSALSDADLLNHYKQHGEAEGRRSNSIASRVEFANLIPNTANSLEIGPFNNPLLRSDQTRYFDVLPRAGLVERAEALNIPIADIPPVIHFVSPAGDLTTITQDFDFVLSSHGMEHQPDLIKHLRDVEFLLRRGGRYFVLIPDKRYCFDHFIAESTLADVLGAHEQKRSFHTLKSLLEHRVLTAHNDTARHWANDHGGYMEAFEQRTKAALQEFAASEGSYIDVHAWYFTPSSVSLLLRALNKLAYTTLTLERLYPTRRDANEFWLVLQK